MSKSNNNQPDQAGSIEAEVRDQGANTLNNQDKTVRTPGSRSYTKMLTTTALMIALAIILGQIKLFAMPQGGEVTLFSTLPIVALGYLLGTRWGVIGGGITGLITLIFGGYVIHPAQLVLDYIIAFAVMGLSGIARDWKNGLTWGYLIGIFARYICAVISGVVFFGEYAPENFNALTWSLWYNITYLAIEGLLTIIVINIPAVKNLFVRFRSQLAN